jgi:tetratricopeptide (TPR) repeat protein
VADSFLSTGSTLVDVIAGVLAEYGPMAEERLGSVLNDRGVVLGADADEALAEALDDGAGVLAVLTDERWVSLPALLAGRVFTRRLSGLEVEHDFLESSPDLCPVDMLTECVGYQLLVDGSPVIGVLPGLDDDTLAARGVPPEVVDDLGALLLPAGYLVGKGLSEGDVISVRVTAQGLLLEAVPDEVMSTEGLAVAGRRLSQVLAARSDEPVLLDAAVWTACADDATLFTEPLPPLGEVLEACGLVCDGEWLAPPGFDFRRWRANARRTAIAVRHDLDDDEAFAVLAIAALYERVADLHVAASETHEGGGDAALTAFATEMTGQPEPSRTGSGTGSGAVVRSVLPVLAEPAVAAAVLAETVGAGSDGAATLGLFAETLEPLAPRAARPALRWLRGKAHERLGDAASAEADYEAAESLDPQWSPALVALARYAGDRGDATRGLDLLRRAGASPDHPLVGLLERFEAGPRPDVGRNDPCWCGSGRKYKKCHLHRERLSLDERAGWLYQKAGMFLTDGPWRAEVADVARERVEFADSPHRLLDALADPLVTDAVLFEGGGFAEFVAARGALLPEDERLLAEQWLLVDRSVFEVEQVRHGEGLTVRDVRTGDVHQVRERTASRQMKVGALICARIVPAGDTTQIFGGIEPVELHERDELISLLDAKPDPVDLVSFLTRRFAPPALRNTEGDPLVLCEVILRTGDPAALVAELDETYARDANADTPQWSEHLTDGPVRATLRLDGADLTVHTNSEARLDRVLGTLRKLGPTLTVVEESRQPARNTREAAAVTPGAQSGAVEPLDPADPEVAAVLDRFVRDYERKWLDEPIPVLAGHTPRQAAADPTRRDDLIRLLGSFPSHPDKPGLMNPDRLRAALDLR